MFLTLLKFTSNNKLTKFEHNYRDLIVLEGFQRTQTTFAQFSQGNKSRRPELVALGVARGKAVLSSTANWMD